MVKRGERKWRNHCARLTGGGKPVGKSPVDIKIEIIIDDGLGMRYSV
jgi:hypothetical protein